MKRILLLASLFATTFLFSQSPSFVWAKRIVNAGNYKPDQGSDIATDPHKNVYVSGYFSDTIIVANDTLRDGSSMTHDGFVMKTKPDGTPLWAIPFRSANDDNASQIRLLPVGDKLIISGKMSGSPATFGNAFSGIITKTYSGWGDFIACIDTSGQLLWVNMIAGVTGGYAPTITVDGNNNIYMAGCFYDNSIVTFMATNGNSTSPQVGTWGGMYLVKMDVAGNLTQHIVEREGSLVYPYYAPYGMDYSYANNSIYITGYFFDSCYVGSTVVGHSTGTTDVFLSNYSTNLTPNWFRNYGGNDNTSASEFGLDVSADHEGNAIISGVFYDTCHFGAITLTDATPGNGEAYIAEINSSGNTVWAKQFHSPNGYLTFYTDIENGNDGSIYLGGAMYTPQVYVSTNLTGTYPNSFDFFIMKTDSIGNFGWFKSGGEFMNDYGSGICISGNNDIYITGALGEAQSYTFDTINHYDANGGGSYYDICYAKLNDPQVTTGMTEMNSFSDALHVFPNPTSDYVKLETDFPAKITITDVQGKIVLEEVTTSGEIYLGLLPNGSYVMSSTSAKQNGKVKLVVIH